MTAIVVGGALANKAGSGGEAWVRLSWIRGLQRLGLDVWFVEELDPAIDDLDGRIAYFQKVTEQFALRQRATLLVDGEAVVGPARDQLAAVAGSAVLVNISGHLADSELLRAFRTRVLVDIDPGYTQAWHLAGSGGAGIELHDRHFTIAERIGAPDCTIPSGGVEWLTVRQPVVLEDWPLAARGDGDRFTTVASWRGPFGPVELDGRRYGLKVHEFRRFLEVPRRASHRFELALDIHPDDERDRVSLLEHGWQLSDPRSVAADPGAFRGYVQGSDAEFSVAQGVYVETNSGWFSDRTVRYLASGKPALVQDTGFSATLPVGEGLVPFRSVDEAVAAADDIVSRYDDHAAAARRIAEEYFDAQGVLTRFCEQIGVEP